MIYIFLIIIIYRFVDFKFVDDDDDDNNNNKIKRMRIFHLEFF